MKASELNKKINDQDRKIAKQKFINAVTKCDVKECYISDLTANQVSFLEKEILKEYSDNMYKYKSSCSRQLNSDKHYNCEVFLIQKNKIE